jgi:dolichol-phosphate mannosyltransferase
LIPTLIRSGLEGKLPPLVHPDTSRDYVHVEDVVDAYLLAAAHPNSEKGAIYNVGTGLQTSLREAVSTIRELLSIKAEPNWGSMPGRIWDTTSWVCDNSKIKKLLGWEPRVSFQEGLQQTISWTRSNREVARL